MITVAVPLVVCVVGALMFALATNAKLVEIGKWCFIVGLFFTVQALASGHVHF